MLCLRKFKKEERGRVCVIKRKKERERERERVPSMSPWEKRVASKMRQRLKNCLGKMRQIVV